MRFLIFITAILMLAGCNGEVRYSADQAKQLAQAKEDATALVIVAKGQTLSEAVASLVASVEARLSAANANQADLPAPAVTATVLIASQPARAQEVKDSAAAKGNPPAGSGWGRWAAVGGAALVALGVLRQLAPMIPGLGPVWAGVINFGYNIAQHSAEKKLDAAQATAANVVNDVADLVRVMKINNFVAYQALPKMLTDTLDKVVAANQEAKS